MSQITCLLRCLTHLTSSTRLPLTHLSPTQIESFEAPLKYTQVAHVTAPSTKITDNLALADTPSSRNLPLKFVPTLTHPRVPPHLLFFTILLSRTPMDPKTSHIHRGLRNSCWKLPIKEFILFSHPKTIMEVTSQLKKKHQKLM